MEIILAVAIFLVIILTFEAGYSLVRGGSNRSLHSVVKKYAHPIEKNEQIDILYYRKYSDIHWVHSLLATIPAAQTLDAFLQQTGTKMLVGVFILLSSTIAAITLLFTNIFINRIEVSAVCALATFFAPYTVLLFKRSKRRADFETLFPDALDLMCYSLKAGHSILASLKMVSEEMSDPVGEEFGYVVDQINFGKSVDSTLRNLARRIDSPELRYFVTSVIIQRDTGGNLVEILSKISVIIRKKFRFREKVKALAAEGKLSAIILTILPFFVGGFILTTNKKYLAILVTDPLGAYFIYGAIILMCIGIIVMYRLVQLDM